MSSMALSSPSTTLTVSAFGCLMTRATTVSLPPLLAMPRRMAVLSSTLATSRRYTGTPPLSATTVSRMSSTEVKRPMPRTVYSVGPVLMNPPEAFSFPPRTAASTAESGRS